MEFQINPDVFSHEPTNDTYDVLVQYYWQLVQLVQNTNYYYSKTDYFDEIKTVKRMAYVR